MTLAGTNDNNIERCRRESKQRRTHAALSQLEHPRRVERHIGINLRISRARDRSRLTPHLEGSSTVDPTLWRALAWHLGPFSAGPSNSDGPSDASP